MLKVAVIGVGNMGMNHIRAYGKLNNVKIVGVSDVNESKKSLFSKESYRFYQDYLKMIEIEKPDVISICVPTDLHYAVTIECLKRKVNILLEKPITDNIDKAKELIATAKKNNLKLLVGHIERFNPAVVRAKEMIIKGELGQICAIAIRRVGGFPPQIKDANIAVDLAIHDIDIANYLMDEIPYEIFSNKQKYHIEKREDSIEIFLKYKKKASAYIQANWISPVKVRKLNVTGTEGYLELDYITQKIEFYKSNYSKFKEASKGYSDYILLFSEPDKISISIAKKEPLVEELRYFVNCVEKDINIDSNFAVDALKIALN